MRSRPPRTKILLMVTFLNKPQLIQEILKRCGCRVKKGVGWEGFVLCYLKMDGLGRSDLAWTTGLTEFWDLKESRLLPTGTALSSAVLRPIPQPLPEVPQTQDASLYPNVSAPIHLALPCLASLKPHSYICSSWWQVSSDQPDWKKKNHDF